MSRNAGLERVLLALFVASGFAGLIYQAIWSHYLGLSLGHAAYAQTLVLAIFMGGMALGAWLVSKRGVNWRRLILAYAIVEVVIGLAGLVFHAVFLGYTGFSQDVVYPALEAPLAVRAWQWGSAALLIAPQSILLGMTFPLMSGGYLRVAPKADGEILGGLYFTNSIGAAFGALFATFVLLPMVGMPGAVMVAGIVNLLVGVAAWAVSRRADVLAPVADPSATPAVDVATSRVDLGFYRMMLLAAGITGASSFVYEIGWVRMLNQALGTTVHSFELMLAAFILGLAFGGLWIRRRSARIADAVAYAGYAQVFMGIAALVSLPVFAQSFRWVGWLMGSLARDDQGYLLFSLGSAGIALLVMFPAAFFAGMTLPLFTMAMLRRGAGEASIGRVYAANTLGAILGVALAVHVLIPFLGLHLAVTLAAIADIVLGIVLLRWYADSVRTRSYLGVATASVAVLCISLVLGRADPQALASGIFRTGQALTKDSVVHFLRDGKTSTIAVYSQGTAGVIATNGKPDASLEMTPQGIPTDDEITMLMAAALPLGLHPDPKRVAIIGWGSGLTTHTMLGSQVPEVVDSIEIERAMFDGARLFGSRNERAYRDPRSKIHIDDARTYFSTGQRRYDVIVSEPSNPWVSGVASLFTRQFYAFLGRHLNEGGILVQWVQSYELNDKLLSTMLAAIVEEFPETDVYLTNQGDVLMVASHSPLQDYRHPERSSQLWSELARVGLAGEQDVAIRKIGSRGMLQALVRVNGAVPHDDFHPVVSLRAPVARFKGESALQMTTLLLSGMPVIEMIGERQAVPLSSGVIEASSSPPTQIHAGAGDIREALISGPTEALAKADKIKADRSALLRRLSSAPVAEGDQVAWLEAVSVLAEYSLAFLPAEDHDGVWINPVWYSGEGQPPALQAVMTAYAAAARRDASAMREAGIEALRQLGAENSSLVHEHMLVIALLGASAAGDLDGVVVIERDQGRHVPVTRDSKYGFVRAFLLAWADQPSDSAKR